MSKYQFRQPHSFAIVSSSNNIPVAFSLSNAGSIAQTGMSDKGYSHIRVINGSSTVISYVTTNAGEAAPSATSTRRVFVPANGYVVDDDMLIIDTILIQSEGSAISSGTVYISIW